MKTIHIITACLLFLGCAKYIKDIGQSPVKDPINADEFLGLYESMVEEAQESQKDHGWLGRDCDGMAFEAPYAASPLVTGIDILAAEYPGILGKFGRRPEPWCWYADFKPTPEKPKQESRGEWSGDMAVEGLIPWAFLTRNLAALERHAEYGEANGWFMGLPKSVETFYSPSLQGLLYYAIYALGGENNPNRLWPGTYKSGLTDFHAHIQMKAIWLRGEIQKELNEFELNGSVISQVMLDRVNEHADRVPEDPFYQYVRGIYTGDMQPAMDAVAAGTVGGHVRCNSGKCGLQYRIFTAGLILKRLGKL